MSPATLLQQRNKHTGLYCLLLLLRLFLSCSRGGTLSLYIFVYIYKYIFTYLYFRLMWITACICHSFYAYQYKLNRHTIFQTIYLSRESENNKSVWIRSWRPWRSLRVNRHVATTSHLAASSNRGIKALAVLLRAFLLLTWSLISPILSHIFRGYLSLSRGRSEERNPPL